jgi:superfamily II helicase
MNKTKVCKNCGKRKRLTSFHNNKATADKKQAYCKPCNISRVRDRVDARAEALRRLVAKYPASFKSLYNKVLEERGIS